jgi:2-amino-4-hydroxy-6-hydroxymethyldihydropteridine diphosphokinase / dihydropteroate synthase
LRPLELLDVLQGIENALGREKTIDKGPRNIDLDIALYDNEQISHDRLIVPHKLMLEREFVLRPLAE